MKNKIPALIAGILFLFLKMSSLIIREIQPADNSHLAKIIKSTLKEFGANHPGTVYYDATTDTLFELKFVT